MVVPPWEDGLTISGVGSDVLVVPELGVAPLVDSETDLEDELPTSDGFPSTDAVKPGEVVASDVDPAPRGGVDLELAAGPSRGCRFANDGNADCGPCRGVVRDSGAVPSTSHSCTMCERPGPCVCGFFPSGGGWEPGSG